MLDALAFGAHPDDVEMQCGGTLLKLASFGYKTGIVDLTRGEMGTRGTPEERKKEAKEAARILKVSLRENLELVDGKINLSEVSRKKVAACIRKHKPKIVFAPYFSDSHPDHAYAGKLIFEGSFIAGLRKYEGIDGEISRPATIIYYPSHYEVKPSFIIDITEFQAEKIKAIQAYESQLHQKNSPEPPTNISNPDFQDRLNLRSRYYGESIGVQFGESFFVRQPVPVADPVALFGETPLEWNGMFAMKLSGDS